MARKEGWQGRVFEDFEAGDVYRHPLGRTITQTDNIWFTLLTVNNNPIHFDAAYAAGTEWGRPLVDSTLTLAIATGLSVTDAVAQQRGEMAMSTLVSKKVPSARPTAKPSTTISSSMPAVRPSRLRTSAGM